jgi:hypothetical protein
MKSFIYEANTIEEAVKKALENAGYPQTFTIKVLEKGQSSFFWWKKKNTKIMFSYEININETIKNQSNQPNNTLQYKGYFEEKSTERNRKYKVNTTNTQQQQKNNFIKPQNRTYRKDTNPTNLEKPDSQNKNLDLQNKNINKTNANQFQKKFDPQNKNANFNSQSNERVFRNGFSLDQSYFIKKWAENFHLSFFNTNKKPIIDFFDANKSCKIFFHNNSSKIEKERLLSLSLSIKYILLETMKIRYNKKFDFADCKIIVYFDNPQENDYKK